MEELVQHVDLFVENGTLRFTLNQNFWWTGKFR